MGHLMMENRNGLIVDARLTEANGTAERITALAMIDDNAKPRQHGWWGQELRHGGVRCRLSKTWLHATRLAERH
jgi:hypothetical protein